MLRVWAALGMDGVGLDLAVLLSRIIPEEVIDKLEAGVKARAELARLDEAELIHLGKAYGTLPLPGQMTMTGEVVTDPAQASGLRLMPGESE